MKTRMKGKSKVSANDALNISKAVAVPAIIVARWAVFFGVVSLIVSALALYTAISK